MLKKISVLFFCAISVFAAESLVSNFTFAVAPGPSTGTLWVLSRGDAGSGVTLVTLALGESQVNVISMKSDFFDQEKTAVHDGVFSDVTGETRRTPFLYTEKLGFVVPMLGLDSVESFRQPEGFYSVKTARILETPLDEPIVELDSAYSSPMAKSIGAFAYDTSTSVLWFSRGVLGLERYDVSSSISDPKIANFVLDAKDGSLDTLNRNKKINASENPPIFGSHFIQKLQCFGLLQRKACTIKLPIDLLKK